MAFASVTNPAPARGGPGAPAAPSRAVQGLPSIGALSNPTIRAAAPGTQANGSVNVGIMCRPWSESWQNHYKEGDLLFVYALEDHINGHMHRVANLPVLNQLLGRRTDGLSNIDNWNFFGVLVSVMDAGHQQRLFSVTVQGRASIPNLWDRKLKPLEKLDLALVPTTGKQFGVSGARYNPIPNAQQLVPLHDGKLKFKEERDPGAERVNPDPRFHIGYVGIRPNTTSASATDRKKGCFMQERSDRLERIEVFIRR